MTNSQAVIKPSRRVYRGRFAPSPTGPLHFGSLFTALASFLAARSVNGVWTLRIDDVDPERSTAEAADAIRRTLEHFELFWDHEIVFQKRNTDRYRSALESLEKRALLYACTCSRKDLAHSVEGPLYPGFCRGKMKPENGSAYALRLEVEDCRITLTDRLQGEMCQDLARDVGDFIVQRRDGVFAYHLATVVDDAEAGITEIVRGADLLDSTPRQIYLQRLLSLPEPAYCHTPIVIDETGAKLSKQTHAAPVDERHPSRTLFRLLRMLQQHPPEELADALPRDLLAWGIAHWRPNSLRGIKTICA